MTDVDDSYCGDALGWDMLAGTYLTYFLENEKDATDSWWEKEGPVVQEKFEKDLGAAMGAIGAGLD